MKIYIAGKVTGEDYVKCLHKFNSYMFANMRSGLTSYNYTFGLRICQPSDTWKQAMIKCIKELVECDEVHMLSDWHESKGAVIEHDLAMNLGIKIIYVK